MRHCDRAGRTAADVALDEIKSEVTAGHRWISDCPHGSPAGRHAGMLNGFVLNYTDTTGSHTQTAAGFTVTLNPAGHPC